MRTSFQALATSLLFLGLSPVATAQTWTSPDGFLTVASPDPTRFQKVPSPPAPFIGLWVSEDETVRFGVVKMEIPPGIKLLQSSAEEGLEEEMGVSVTRLPTKRISGHEVWIMSAKGESADITQSMIQNDAAIYKLMAITVSGSPDEGAVASFIDSLSINQSPSQAPSQRSDDSGIDTHNLSKRVASGAFILLAIAIYLRMRKRKAK